MQGASEMLVRLPETTVIALARQIQGNETIAETIGRLAGVSTSTSVVPRANGSSPRPARRSRFTTDRYAIVVLGEVQSFYSLADCLVYAVDVLARLDNAFLPQIAKRGGRTRRHVADARGAIYPGRSDLLKYVRELPSHPGWWIGTNYSRSDVERILKDASNAAGLHYGQDVRLEDRS